MTNAIPLTLAGNLTADPEYRSHEGREYANFTVASSERVYNQQDRTWGDGPVTYMPCSLSGSLVRGLKDANVVKGRRVLVHGVLRTRWWQDRDTGKDRSRPELRVEHIGLIPLPVRDGRQGGGQGGGMRPGTAGDQPWGGQQQGGGGGWAPDSQGWQPGDDETPF